MSRVGCADQPADAESSDGVLEIMGVAVCATNTTTSDVVDGDDDGEAVCKHWPQPFASMAIALVMVAMMAMAVE